MTCYKRFVFMLILVAFKLNAVSTQNETSLLEILDMLGLDPLEIANIVLSVNPKTICEELEKSTNDDLCYTQLKLICRNENFLLRMLDATSKFPYAGMLIRTRIDYGSYDECINLDMSQNDVRVIGKHCVGGIILPTTKLNDTDFFEKAFKLSICIPDGCSAKDLMTVMNISSELQVINDFSCSTKETWKNLEADDYAAIVALLVIVMVMVIATLYDVYLNYTNKDCRHILLQAFSVYYNGRKLLQVSTGPSDQIKVIHGLRVFSMMWIILAHSFGTMNVSPGINTDFSLLEWTRKTTYITSAYLAVDTFFFLSGLLLAYQYLKQDAKPLKAHIRKVPYMYLHRYLRVTPVAAAAFIALINIISHVGDGPIYYNTLKLERNTCLKYWWSYFLYIQNYVNYDDLCIEPSWYLSADWQLFLIAPIILIPVAVSVKRNFRWIMGCLLLLNIFLTVAPFGLKFLFNDFNNMYETHSVMIDYFIGLMLGVFMREKCHLKYRLSATLTFFIWLLVLFIMTLTTLLHKEVVMAKHFNNDLSYNSYYILLRPLWCIGLSWIIYSCHNEYGGFINWLLTNPCVQILSKLTYCMYITHICPLIHIRLTARNPIVYSQATALSDWVVTYFVTVILATFWTLAFESPLITLEKYFLGTKRQ